MIAPTQQRAFLRRISRKGNDLLAAALLLSGLVIVVFPIYWFVSSSMSEQTLFDWPPTIIPRSLTFEAYVRVLGRPEIVIWLRNTLIVGCGATILTLIVSVPAALSISRYQSIFARTSSGALLATQMLPATLMVIPLYMTFSQMGLLDSLLGLIVVDAAFAAPLAIWMLKGFFDGFPRELEEAAMIDGCSEPQAYLLTTLRLSLPGIAAVAVFTFMAAWGEYFFARTLVNDQDEWVFAVGLSVFRGEYTVAWNELMAASWLFSLPALLFFLLTQRWIVAGMTSGAIKE